MFVSSDSETIITDESLLYITILLQPWEETNKRIMGMFNMIKLLSSEELPIMGMFIMIKLLSSEELPIKFRQGPRLSTDSSLTFR
jgi:hypothetical protein